MLTMKENSDRLDKLQGKGWPGSRSISVQRSADARKEAATAFKAQLGKKQD